MLIHNDMRSAHLRFIPEVGGATTGFFSEAIGTAGAGSVGIGVLALPSANFCFSLCFFQASSFSRLILCFSSSVVGPAAAGAGDLPGDR